MKVLITGGNGMLASAIKRVFTDHEIISTDKDNLDITNIDEVIQKLGNFKPDVVINCAAYTDVNGAESDEGTAHLVNAVGAENIAKATRDLAIRYIHISTDYVFGAESEDGYDEASEPQSQINVYGKTKREGEIAVMNANPNAYVVRTAWIYGEGGKNFVDTMIMLAEKYDELTIVEDEVGTPTWTDDLARTLLYITEHVDALAPGYYHGINEGRASRFEQAETIFKELGIRIKLNKILLDDYQRAAKVPHISILLNKKLPKLPHWKVSLQKYLEKRS